MKKYFIASAVALTVLFAACNNSQTAEKPEVKGTSYGEVITAENAKPVAELPAIIGDKTELENVKLEGTITECCQKKGCWMKLDMGNGKSMRVTFKDYEFFVPKDAAGKKAIIEGKAYVEETSVEDLKHYAKDAGKPQSEIDKITAPEKELTFEARGVILK